MSENPQEDREHVKFQWGAEGSALCIQCWYGETRLHLDFNDDSGQGTRDMHKIIATMPFILKTIRNERMIRKEVEQIDGDLLALLDDGDNDE